ncbi:MULTISPECIES: hypothetical protein [unclassified Wolbachia]|uniref:hypothetical protein n=1 Tax=unclassified Wolbachia TaxID=2640676 RepID=UPI002226F743|nr:MULTISPECIES: hypothetical protein [unclassified Wolbachia]
MKTNIDEPCAGNLQARFFRGSCSNKTQTRGVKLQLLPNTLDRYVTADFYRVCVYQRPSIKNL